MERERYLLWLSSLDISCKARAAVIGAFQTAEAAFSSEKGSFLRVKGISKSEAEQLEKRDLTATEEILDRCCEQNIDIIPWDSAEYPERLREITHPPVALFVQGNMPKIDELPVLSIIGTRNASPYGEKMSRRMASEITACGGTVVSLLNSGLDESAARGAILSGGMCLGVLGTAHEKFRSPIREDFWLNGVLISEYPPGRTTSRYFFRERNRIAAGLSVGVVVVEAPERSGTRFFVQEAIEQGKDVFAVPGNADSENSAGTLAMIKDGAKLVTCGKEVMEEYELRFPTIVLHAEMPDDNHNDSSSGDEKEEAVVGQEAPETIQQDLRAQLAGLTADQLKIITAIDENSSHIDDIAEKTELSTAKVLSQLTLLEIKGFVRREIGRRFSLNINRKEK